MAIDKTMKILLVHDERPVIKILRMLFRTLDFHNVEEAADSGLAIRLLRSERYGLVVACSDTEPVSGIELAKSLRADPALRSIPILLAMLDNRPAAVAAAQSASVDACLYKPLAPDTLRTALRGIFGEFA